MCGTHTSRCATGKLYFYTQLVWCFLTKVIHVNKALSSFFFTVCLTVKERMIKCVFRSVCGLKKRPVQH